MLRVENRPGISLVQSGLYMKVTLYLLPNYGSDTKWYKNFLVDPTLKISVSGSEEIPARGAAITDSGRVKDVLSKFSSKYGDVRKYYPKPDVAVQVPL